VKQNSWLLIQEPVECVLVTSLIANSPGITSGPQQIRTYDESNVTWSHLVDVWILCQLCQELYQVPGHACKHNIHPTAVWLTMPQVATLEIRDLTISQYVIFIYIQYTKNKDSSQTFSFWRATAMTSYAWTRSPMLKLRKVKTLN